MSDPNPTTTDERLARLEETVGFTQHDVEQLSGELIRAFEVIERLRAEIKVLDGKLKSQIEREDMPGALEERPPHSAG